MCLNATCTGVERLDVVQVSHWKLAEMTGEAKRNRRSSKFLLMGVYCVCTVEMGGGRVLCIGHSVFTQTNPSLSFPSSLSGSSPDIFLKSKEAILTGS